MRSVGYVAGTRVGMDTEKNLAVSDKMSKQALDKYRQPHKGDVSNE